MNTIRHFWAWLTRTTTGRRFEDEIEAPARDEPATTPLALDAPGGYYGSRAQIDRVGDVVVNPALIWKAGLYLFESKGLKNYLEGLAAQQDGIIDNLILVVISEDDYRAKVARASFDRWFAQEVEARARDLVATSPSMSLRRPDEPLRIALVRDGFDHFSVPHLRLPQAHVAFVSAPNLYSPEDHEDADLVVTVPGAQASALMYADQLACHIGCHAMDDVQIEQAPCSALVRLVRPGPGAEPEAVIDEAVETQYRLAFQRRSGCPGQKIEVRSRLNNDLILSVETSPTRVAAPVKVEGTRIDEPRTARTVVETLDTASKTRQDVSLVGAAIPASTQKAGGARSYALHADGRLDDFGATRIGWVHADEEGIRFEPTIPGSKVDGHPIPVGATRELGKNEQKIQYGDVAFTLRAFPPSSAFPVLAVLGGVPRWWRFTRGENLVVGTDPHRCDVVVPPVASPTSEGNAPRAVFGKIRIDRPCTFNLAAEAATPTWICRHAKETVTPLRVRQTGPGGIDLRDGNDLIVGGAGGWVLRLGSPPPTSKARSDKRAFEAVGSQENTVMYTRQVDGREPTRRGAAWLVRPLMPNLASMRAHQLGHTTSTDPGKERPASKRSLRPRLHSATTSHPGRDQ